LPIDFNTTVIILGSLVAVIGGAIGLKLASRLGKGVDEQTFNSRLGFLMEENKELKKYLKQNKGSLAQLKQGLTLPDGSDVESADEGAVDGMIKGLMGKYAQMCPPQFRPFLQDPAIQNFLLSEAKKNPEMTKDILKNFIGKNGKIGKESGTGQPGAGELEALALEGA